MTMNMVMISNSPNYNPLKLHETNSSQKESLSITNNNPFPSWKLYENPFYRNLNHKRDTYNCQVLINKQHHHHHHYPFPCYLNDLPLSSSSISSAPKVATPPPGSVSSRIRPMVMEKELDLARAQITGLKAEIEHERKSRKKLETMYKRLAKELAEERKKREALGTVCKGLVEEILLDKAELDNAKKEMEDERKMLRVAEVFREERVRMKLAEAKVFFEEKLMELEGSVKQGEWNSQVRKSSMKMEDRSLGSAGATPHEPDHHYLGRALSGSLKFSRLVLEEKSCDENCRGDGLESSRVVLGEKPGCNENVGEFSPAGARRVKASPEPENPHIKRGIRGFVEFPRCVRATGGGSNKHRHWGTKLECQKAQLRILLKQKYISNPVQ